MRTRTIKKELCRTCRGTGLAQTSMRIPCLDCEATGYRYVPSGYRQEDLDQVRYLVDAMARTSPQVV